MIKDFTWHFSEKTETSDKSHQSMGSCTMQPFLGILLGVLLALVAKSYSLSCIQCSSETSTFCTGSSVSCSSGSLCTVIYTVQTIGNSSLTSYTMTCAPQTQCDVNGTISITGSNVKMASSCCSTDNCIPYLPSLPADSSVSNGWDVEVAFLLIPPGAPV